MCRGYHSACHENTFYERAQVLEKGFAGHEEAFDYFLKFMWVDAEEMATWKQIQDLAIIFHFALCLFSSLDLLVTWKMSWKCRYKSS